MFRQCYFEVLGTTINGIQSRFTHPDYQIYRNLQMVIFKTVKRENFKEEFDTMIQMYRDDFKDNNLEVQLKTLPNLKNFHEDTSFIDIVNYINSLSPNKRNLINEVVKLIKIVLVERKQMS